VGVEGEVQLWSLESGELKGRLPISTKAVSGMAFSPDGTRLAAGAADGRIRVWALE
jgi:WD40 repeat protein